VLGVYPWERSSHGKGALDGGSLKFENSTLPKDKDHAYWLGKEIAGADVATFQTINDVMAKDKFRRYSGSGEFWMDKRAREANSPTP
jgi:hypothetical protein